MRSEWILGGLLAVALTASYLTWTSDSGEEATVTDGAPIYTASADDLAAVTWKGEKATIKVERRQDATGPYLWVTVVEQVQKREPGAPEAPSAAEEPTTPEDPDAEEAPATEPPEAPAAPIEYEDRTTEFLGNDAADTMWAAFAPLVAMRQLDTTLDATQEAAFGFDKATATIEVQRKSGPLDLTVGGETYGSKDRYLKADGKVWLVADATVRPLQYGKTRLMERRLQPLDEAKMEKVVVEHAGGSTTFAQQNKDDRAQAFWTRDGATEKAELESTWLGKLFRLRVQSYDKIPEDVTLVPKMAFTVVGDGKSYKVELLEGGDQYWARSSYSRAVVKLTKSVAADALADLPSVLAAAPAGDDAAPAGDDAVEP